MTTISELKKNKDETEEQYLWRIGNLIDSGQLASWASVNDIVNKELGIEEDKWRDESSFRKRYQAAKKFYDNCFSKMETKDYQDQLAVMNRELVRNQVRFRDERRSWNKQNYSDARIEELMALLEEEIPKIGNLNFEIHDVPYPQSETELFVSLADLHIGADFKSYWGEYNPDVARKRLEKYLDRVIEIGDLHNVSIVHVGALGDEISGLIHSTIQITNKENVVEQVKTAIELISSFCYGLTEHFSGVYFYSIPGNHSRLNPKKDEVLRDERLDDLIGWTVCKLLEHIENFHDMTHRKFDYSIGEASICGNSYLLIHGDSDSITKQGIGNLVTMIGFCPKYIITAHKHTPAMNEFNGITVYQSGSLVGSGDDYTVKNRMNGDPSQMVLVCDKSGVVCNYNVKL